MEIKQLFKNYKEGGNNYILKADSKNRWSGFDKNIIDKLYSKYELKFNIVLWGTKSDTDFYCIPYWSIEHLFTTEHMTKGKIAEQGYERWTATIENHVFKMRANSMYSVNIEKFYGKKEPLLIKGYEEIDEIFGVDYTIEDAKANVKIRLGQSEFRKAVLENFQGKCCISGITEQSMLEASHIVPWSKNKNYRSDPSNGLCLFIEYHAYFDKGYISIDESLNILVTERISELSYELTHKINQLKGRKIQNPVKYKIKNEYIEFHRKYILNQFDK